MNSVGVLSSIAIYKNHINLLFDTGIKTKNYRLITTNKDDLVIHENGNLLMPIEITALNDDFYSAWKKGASYYRNSFGNHNKSIDVKDLWREYPSFSFENNFKNTNKNSKKTSLLVNAIKKFSNSITEERGNRISELKSFSNNRAKLIEQVYFLQLQGDYKEAITLIKKSDYKKSNSLLNSLGCLYIAQGKYKTAEKILTKIYKKDLTGRVAFNRALLFYLRSINKKESLYNFKKALSEAIKINPLLVKDIDALGLLSSKNITKAGFSSSKQKGKNHVVNVSILQKKVLLTLKSIDDLKVSGIFSETSTGSDEEQKEETKVTGIFSETSTGSEGKDDEEEKSSGDMNIHITRLLFWFHTD